MIRHKTLLLGAGTAAFALSLAYLYVSSSQRAAETADATYEPRVVHDPADTIETPLESPRVTEEPPQADAFDDELIFDDTPLPDSEDELLIIDNMESVRHSSAQDLQDEERRQQRTREASLLAANYAGDERVQMIGTLGAYASEGSADAITELREVLQSPDPELRADALEAIAGLLSNSDAVPPYSEQPLSDEQVDQLIDALRASGD
ncbi:MAG: hypothetical protein QNJ05_11925 [Woeseiaceae bacterium]|nr:hypothetical protein [Woeseiaceae bacterium]